MADTALWANRNFRLVFSASAISNLGDGVTLVALPWLATMLTRDPVLIGLVATAGRLPWLLLSLPAGVWTDRADLRQLILRADMIRAGLTLAVVWLAVSGMTAQAGAIYVLAGLAFLLGAAEVIRDNAAQSLLPRLLAPDLLERANGQMWSVEEVMTRFIGPPLAGVLIGLGIALPFGLDASSFLISALLVSLIALPAAVPKAQMAFWPALKEGMVWMRGHPVLMRLALMLAVVNGFYAATLAIMVLYAQETLGLSAVGYGILLTAGAVAGVLGGLLGPMFAAWIGALASLRLALAMMVLAYLLLALVPVPLVAGLALFIEAGAGILWNIVTVSYRQRVIPPALMGRVNAIYRFFGTGAMAVGALAGGVIVALAEPALGRVLALQLPFLLAAFAYAGLTLYALAGRFRI